MKIEDYEEITESEFNQMEGGIRVQDYVLIGKTFYYFKKIQKFPIVFKDDDRGVEVYENGDIEIIDFGVDKSISFSSSLELLYKGVDKSREMRKKDESK